MERGIFIMKIKDISRISGREIATIMPNATLSEAVEKMVDNSIGALPVCEGNGKLVGIISERDIIKWLYRSNSSPDNTKVKSVMTGDVLIGLPEDDIEVILKTMTENNIRHLPVMSGDSIIEILSIRDVIEEKLTECSTQVRHLHDYIAGGSLQ
jgi:CBS domain-containing protein